MSERLATGSAARSGNRIRAGSASGVLTAIAAAGGTPARALAGAGISASALADPDRMVDVEAIVRLFDAAAREVGDDCFGLHIGETYDFGGGLGALSHAVLNAPTVATAIANLERYSRTFLTGGRLGLARDDTDTALVYDLGIADRERCRHHAEGAAVVGVRLLRSLVGPDWRPVQIRFGHARPSATTEHARLLGAPIRFDAGVMVAVVIAAADLERPVRSADRTLLPIIQRHLDEQLAAVNDPDDWLAPVRKAVAETVCDGAPTIQTIAKRLGASVRTLQRRLGAHDVVFKDLVADTRRDLALRYLAQGSVELTEIAFLLGYSELSAFHRAFRRWTGETPQAARKRLAGC